MIKLLIGGSPCTYWSIAQKNNRETKAEGLGWELFKNYLIAKEKFKPDYFLYENNKSAAQEIKDQIKKELNVFDGTLLMQDSGARYIEINSALVSAQNRQRFYVHNCGGVGQPEDRGVMLSDILESGVTDKDKAYCLKHQAGNARDYFKKHHTQVVYEPVIIQNAHGFNKGGLKQGKTPTLTANGKWIYNNPVAIPCGTGKTDKARTLTAGYQTSSHRDFEVDITSGGQLGHTGVIERVFPINTTKEGKAQTIKAQYKFTSVQNICCYNSTYGASGVAIPATKQDKEKRKNAKNAIEKVYEVKNGYITIKEKQYAVNLPDGFYIIRKLTVTECCRLQTLPDDYCRVVSNAQAYKGLGNGWTAEVIIHILSGALKNIPKHEKIVVLSMYDGIGTGRYCLDKMGFKNVEYHAYEIDKYAMEVAKSNYPDIIYHGDAFGVRSENWSL